MDEKTRTLPVVVEIDERTATAENQDNLHLRPGLFVTVRIAGRKIKQIYDLPRHVLHGDDTLYLVEDNRLKIKTVNILRRFKNSIIIDKGLSDGDLIIQTPLSGAVEGMQVRLHSENRG